MKQEQQAARGFFRVCVTFHQLFLGMQTGQRAFLGVSPVSTHDFLDHLVAVTSTVAQFPL